jgi:hypothetical protein
MTKLILDDEQAQILRSSLEVELRDRAGNLLGRALTPDEEDLRIIKQRLANPEPKSTRAEVKEHLEHLEMP